jgi:hypothetical protein
MVWGYGTRGYGPFRTARVLTESANASDTLSEAAVRVRRDGGVEAFRWLAANRLRWLGVAFATKFLYFCNVDPGKPPALVLDARVQGWLRQHADWRINLDWRVSDYEHYVHTTMRWADQLGVTPSEAEYLMFSDAVSADPTSQWAAPHAASGEPPAGELDLDAWPAEAVAVLETLDEAAELFTMLPTGRDAADVDDFEYGLRQLRHIVYARMS